MRNTENRRYNIFEKNRRNSSDEEVKEQIQLLYKDRIIDDLKKKINTFEEKAIESDKNSEILAKLFECGVINEDGELLLENKKKDNE